MMASWHQPHVAVFDHHRLVEAAVIGVDPLDAKPLCRVQPVIIGLLQVGDVGKVVLVVAVATGRLTLRSCKNLH